MIHRLRHVWRPYTTINGRSRTTSDVPFDAKDPKDTEVDTSFSASDTVDWENIDVICTKRLRAGQSPTRRCTDGALTCGHMKSHEADPLIMRQDDR